MDETTVWFSIKQRNVAFGKADVATPFKTQDSTQTWYALNLIEIDWTALLPLFLLGE